MTIEQVDVVVSNSSRLFTGWLALFYLFLAFIVAFCSMSYELVLAQTITLLYGSTVLNYTLIVGVYIFSLGMGAALHSRYARSFGSREQDFSASLLTFCKIELILCVAGGLSPFLILLTETAVGQASVDLVTPFAAVLAVGIGLLSGMEIPVLLSVANHDPHITENSDRNRHIIGLDFIGTFAAAALVPLVCFPFLGILRTAVLTACINSLIALICLWRLRRGQVPLLALSSLTMIALFLLATYAVDVGQLLLKEIF